MSKNISSSRVVCLLLLGALISFSSCKKEKFNPNSTGKNVLSEEDLLNLNSLDTIITIYSYPILADSVKTDEVASEMLLGGYVDPVFGLTETSVYSQFVFSDTKDFSLDAKDGDINNLTVDSVILSMPLSKIYGTNEPQTFEVYKLDEQMSKNDDYYSNDILSTLPTNLVEPGKETITPDLDKGEVALFLSTTIGDDVIAQNGSSVLSSSSDFISWFKGLHITTNNSFSSGEGAILNIMTGESADSTSLTIYYHDVDAPTTPLSFEMRINETTARFNHFYHDYTGTTVKSALDNKTLGNAEFYVQSMGGINSEIDFPFIENLAQNQNIIIRKAELVLPFNESSTYDENESLIALAYDENGNLTFTPDQFIGNIGGSVNTTDKNYTLNITNFINDIVNDRTKDSRLLIAPIGASVVPNRTIFNGQESVNTNKIELKISYTTY